jgi:hypothetical protein
MEVFPILDLNRNSENERPTRMFLNMRGKVIYLAKKCAQKLTHLQIFIAF